MLFVAKAYSFHLRRIYESNERQPCSRQLGNRDMLPTLDFMFALWSIVSVCEPGAAGEMQLLAMRQPYRISRRGGQCRGGLPSLQSKNAAHPRSSAASRGQAFRSRNPCRIHWTGPVHTRLVLLPDRPAAGYRCDDGSPCHLCWDGGGRRLGSLVVRDSLFFSVEFHARRRAVLSIKTCGLPRTSLYRDHPGLLHDQTALFSPRPQSAAAGPQSRRGANPLRLYRQDLRTCRRADAEPN